MISKAQKHIIYSYLPVFLVCVNAICYALIFIIPDLYVKYQLLIEHYTQGSFVLLFSFWLKASETFVFKRSLLCLSMLWCLNLFLILYMMWSFDYDLNIYVKIALGIINLCFLGISIHALLCSKK